MTMQTKKEKQKIETKNYKKRQQWKHLVGVSVKGLEGRDMGKSLGRSKKDLGRKSKGGTAVVVVAILGPVGLAWHT